MRPASSASCTLGIRVTSLTSSPVAAGQVKQARIPLDQRPEAKSKDVAGKLECLKSVTGSTSVGLVSNERLWKSKQAQAKTTLHGLLDEEVQIPRLLQLLPGTPCVDKPRRYRKGVQRR